MKILYATDRLRNSLWDDRQLLREGGRARLRRLRERLTDLEAAASLAFMKQLPGHCEELKGDLKGQLSIRLEGPYRLLFEVADEPAPVKEDGGLDWSLVTSIRILRIEDYHD